MWDEKILAMPKIDLHCHLDGSMTLESISALLEREVQMQELQVSEECKSLAEYLRRFDLPLECLQTREGLKRSAKDFLLSLQKDNVKYVEVRFAPQLSAAYGLSCAQVVEAVLEGLKEAKEVCGIHSEVIVCMMRHHDEETNLKMLKECREFLREGICAADIAGDEAGFPTKNFYELFQWAKKLDYPFTIHAGECEDVNSVLHAVEFGAKRIGHGIAMKGNNEAQKLVAKKHIAVEMCPISNYQTKALAADDTYPIREFDRAGVLVTVNTDNRTVSNTSSSKEMCFLRQRFGIDEEELRKYQLNAVEAAFCDDAVKHTLWKLYH